MSRSKKNIAINFLKNIMDLKFKVYSQPLEKQIQTEDNDLILEGIASTTSTDLEGDYMTRECIESMKEQALSCNIHGNHEYGLNNIIGTVSEVAETDEDTLKIKFHILPSYQDKIKELLENGVSLGLSVGGTVLDYDKVDDGWKIKKLHLHEISLTPMPANWDTFGTVNKTEKELTVEGKCLNGVCKTVLKELNDLDNTTIMTNKEVKNAESAGEEPVTQQQVIDMINEALNEAKDVIISEIVDEIGVAPEEKELEEKDENDDEGKVEVEVVDEENQTTEETEPEEASEEEDDEDKKDKSIDIDSLTESIMKNVLKELEAEKEAERLAKEKEAKAQAEKESLMKELREEIEADILSDLQETRTPSKKEYTAENNGETVATAGVNKMSPRDIAKKLVGQ